MGRTQTFSRFLGNGLVKQTLQNRGLKCIFQHLLNGKSVGLNWSAAACLAARPKNSFDAVKRAQIAKQKVQIFKPAIDNRFSETAVVSHSEQTVIAVAISHPEEIIAAISPESRSDRH
jgi:thymidine kinase